VAVAIDHVILAVDDLQTAAARLLHATGLATAPGGTHPDWGTANVIVPLGEEYVELVTVVDPELAAGSGFGRRVAAAGDGELVGWAASVDDLDAVAARHGLDVVRGRRTLADGSTLSWTMAGADTALHRGLPFFLRWDDPTTSPARATAPHRAQPHGIRWIKTTTARAELDVWLGPHDLDVRTVASGPARAGIAVGGGEVVVG
jgi:hypothetical protein